MTASKYRVASYQDGDEKGIYEIHTLHLQYSNERCSSVSALNSFFGKNDAQNN